MWLWKKSYTKAFSKAKIMIDALSNISDSLPKDLDVTFIDNLSASRDKVLTYNAEKEMLEADLKSKAKQLKDEMKKMKKLYAEAKKSVKYSLPKEEWEEFGINDKK